MMERDNPLVVPTFMELMRRKDDLTGLEKVLIQAVALVSTQEGYTHLTPQDVYWKLVEQTEEVHVHETYDPAYDYCHNCSTEKEAVYHPRQERDRTTDSEDRAPCASCSTEDAPVYHEGFSTGCDKQS